MWMLGREDGSANLPNPTPNFISHLKAAGTALHICSHQPIILSQLLRRFSYTTLLDTGCSTQTHCIFRKPGSKHVPTLAVEGAWRDIGLFHCVHHSIAQRIWCTVELKFHMHCEAVQLRHHIYQASCHIKHGDNHPPAPPAIPPCHLSLQRRYKHLLPSPAAS